MTFAFVALFSWPIVVFWLFSKYSRATALAVSIIGGYLLLPGRVNVDLPMLPALEKDSVPALAAMLALIVFSAKQTDALQKAAGAKHNKLVILLMLTALVGPFLTVMTNGDALQYGRTFVPPMGTYDAFSFTLTLLMLLLPFVLSYLYLGHEVANKAVLMIMAVSGLLYALPTLIEVWISPQLNRMVYGFFPHSFLQHMRGGGFRPIVFLEHGLWVSIFFTKATLAALVIWRLGTETRSKQMLYGGVFLFLVLIATKSLGALMIAIFLAPLVLFARVHVQLLMAAIVAAIVLTYPMLRGAGWVPVDSILTQVHSISPERAQSLIVRTSNEERLLAKASQRPAFGWGGYGRSRVYDERGRDISVTDGYWILNIGIGGWLRYLTVFGLLTGPLILLFWKARTLNVGFATSGLAMVQAANLIDLIPNATGTPVTWLIAGALWGRLAYASNSLEVEPQPDAPTDRHKPRSRGTEPIKGIPDGVVYTRQTTPRQRKTLPN